MPYTLTRLWLRLRLAAWAARHPDTLTMLHFEMLRDSRERDDVTSGLSAAALRAHFYAQRLTDSRMPGAQENIAAL